MRKIRVTEWGKRNELCPTTWNDKGTFREHLENEQAWLKSVKGCAASIEPNPNGDGSEALFRVVGKVMEAI